MIVFIGKHHLQVGLKHHPSIIDGELNAAIKVDEATWVIEDKKHVVISMEKVRKNEYYKLLL